MIGKLIGQVRKWSFSKTVNTLISFSIVLTATIILIISTISSTATLTQKSKSMAVEQMNTMAANFENTLTSYKEMAMAVTINPHVQSYLKGENRKEVDLANNARNVLASTINMTSNMNFIAIVHGNTGEYLYKGDITIAASKFPQFYEADYAAGQYASTGQMKISFSNAYYDGERYSLTVYFPIYNVNRINMQLGLLCVNFNDPTLDQIMRANENGLNPKVGLISLDQTVFAAPDTEMIGTRITYGDRLAGRSGDFRADWQLVLYQRIGAWNYDMVSTIPIRELYRDSINTLLILVCIIVLMAGLFVWASGRVIRLACRPLVTIVRKMDDVSDGKLDVRIETQGMGEDFARIAVGFNSMMDDIQALMEQVKTEQHQMEQIRFNALQAQIQPHFLYNTLDCIHWKALSNGNKDISVLVKALASYYRICLSNGQDIITLKQECEHIRNYLIIQNMRYGAIIDSEIVLAPAFEEVLIPKLTLQPLVENAIYHGIKIREGGEGKITLRVRPEENAVLILVEDNGHGMTPQQIDEMNTLMSDYDESFGYGVRNVNKRIELLFGEEYGLHYGRNRHGGVTVEVRLPLEQEIKYRGVL